MEEQREEKETLPVRKNENRGLLLEIVVIVGLSILLGLVYNAFSTKGIPLIRVAPQKAAAADSELFSQVTPVQKHPTPTDTVTDSATHQKIPVFAPLHQKALANPDSMAKLAPRKNKEYTIVNLDQVKKLLEQRRTVFIDARNAAEYAEGHIIGSQNIPFLEIEKHFEELMKIPQDTLVVIYCNGPNCELGLQLADFMAQMQFKHLYLYDDGWDGWEKAKMPFEGTRAKQ